MIFPNLRGNLLLFFPNSRGVGVSERKKKIPDITNTNFWRKYAHQCDHVQQWHSILTLMKDHDKYQSHCFVLDFSVHQIWHTSKVKTKVKVFDREKDRQTNTCTRSLCEIPCHRAWECIIFANLTLMNNLNLKSQHWPWPFRTIFPRPSITG